jgi:hypothetical protein
MVNMPTANMSQVVVQDGRMKAIPHYEGILQIYTKIHCQGNKYEINQKIEAIFKQIYTRIHYL